MGTRMRSNQPKVMHQIGGLSMVGHVIKTALQLGTEKLAVVIGPNMDDVKQEVSSHVDNPQFFIQEERLGTAHAVLAARSTLEGHDGPVLVLYGDTPLITPASLELLLSKLTLGHHVGVLGFDAIDPHGYGRLLENETGLLVAIREDAELQEGEKEISLCNSGVMAFSSGCVLELLDQINNDNKPQEYYLTDAVEVANANQMTAVASRCSEREVLGINDRVQLGEAETIFQSRMRLKAQEEGATLIGPETIFFSHDTKLGQDVVVEPNVIFGPGTSVGDGVQIAAFSHLTGTSLGKDAVVGPFARLRPGARIGEAAKIGNFVEIKNADIAMGAKVNHLSYIGDAFVGEAANIGAGTITCNYDGYFKHKTDIGRGAFIGSNSSLIAPLKIGDGAYIGSGSVISQNVPDDALALTRAPRQIFEEWAARYRKSQTRKKQSKKV